ncbi:MAG TPA: hypothetical protein VGN72_19870 [Tepidisphaeraceae bacterium]|nr:hypothetical protein [Tepidisphaeraceae bacterium]
MSVYSSDKPDTCRVPPPGWSCSRPAGHEGPCAASPINSKVIDRNVVMFKPDGVTPRHPSTSGVLKHFRCDHLPVQLREVSQPFANLAFKMADELPEGPDLTCGLRDLLTAKDNCVRAKLG